MRVMVPAPLGYVYPGEVSELADERDLGSRGATRAGSSPAFPTNRAGFRSANARVQAEDAGQDLP